MAYFLRTPDSSNTAIALQSFITLFANVGDYLEFTGTIRNSNGQSILGINNSFDDFIQIQTSRVRMRLSPSNLDFSQNYTMPSPSVVFTLRFERISTSQIQGFLDGTSIGIVNTTDSLNFNQLLRSQLDGVGRYEGDFYKLAMSTDGGASVTNNYDPSASNGTGSTLPDTAGSNDGTLVNFPTDDSQWVFYDDGQGGGDTLIPTLIPSGEVVGTPSVTNLLKLIEPNTIPTEELVSTPTVNAGAILISPATIPTGEVVYNVSVVDLTQFIAAEDIPTQEAVGSPSLELLLSRIFPTAIATQENFETPLIIGGDRIAIPINDRATWNRVAAYLRTRKFSGNDNDVILAWLRSEGYIDTFNDAFNTYLEDVEALDGSLTDKYSNWRRQ